MNTIDFSIYKEKIDLYNYIYCKDNGEGTFEQPPPEFFKQ